MPDTPSDSTYPSPNLKISEYSEYQGLVANTPVRRLRKLVTRSDVQVWAKLEGTNLGGSVKDRAALSMITAAEKAGHTSGVGGWWKRPAVIQALPWL